MRRVLSVVALAVTATILSVAQQNPPHKADIDARLVELRSGNAEVRSEALERLRSDPVALRDSNVKTALVSLLDRENHVTPSSDDEGSAEYVSWLADTVARVVDWNDSRQVCILADSVDLPDQLADHAKVSIPCLLQRSKNAPALLRGAVVAMMVQALAKGKNDLDAATIQEVLHVTLSALHDPDEGVRIDTVKALGKFGGEDMIPALKEIAAKDPSQEVHGYSIRKWAAEAIAAIQKRAGRR